MSDATDNSTRPAGPGLILLLRHAEKPGDPGDETSGGPDLSEVGRQRALALAGSIPARFPGLNFLVATRPSHNSNRPVETITPLAGVLNLPIRSDFRDDDFGALAEQLLEGPEFAGAKILVCWHHGRIPDLARALGAGDAPEKWPKMVFDRIWRLDYSGDPPAFSNLPQGLLPGDST